jgi:hypothetical protein
MPRTQEDVENYLNKLGRRYEPHGSTIIVSMGNGTQAAMRVAAPIISISVTIGPPPEDDARQLKLFRRLLELNARDLMHSSYGLENEQITLSAALALDNLDENELDATLSDIDVALVTHTAELIELARSSTPG